LNVSLDARSIKDAITPIEYAVYLLNNLTFIKHFECLI
jgi:hypothetical protein